MAGTGTVRWIEKEGLVMALRYHPTLVELCEEIGDGRGMVSRQRDRRARAARGRLPRDHDHVAQRARLRAATGTSRPTRRTASTSESLERTYAFCGALLERLDESIGPELA